MKPVDFSSYWEVDVEENLCSRDVSQGQTLRKACEQKRVCCLSVNSVE